jgi:hypothetical protein
MNTDADRFDPPGVELAVWRVPAVILQEELEFAVANP